ncbi:MAG: alpha/beta hydrolase [Massilia sp.]|nr:alpha/beta hydrolase [Massilia sp.]
MHRVLIHPAGGAITLEVESIGAARAGARRMVFLHEGLGSLARWGDWPRALCDAAGCRGLVFSRHGYGRSQTRPPPWPSDYLDVEAHENLPALFKALGIDPVLERPILFGHSDGATIALQYAAAFPDAVEAIVVLAPHLFTEQVARERIEQLRRGWHDGRLRAWLAQWHMDADAVFQGWSGCWLSPQFERWNISASLAAIRCPVLAVQGALDQYGTLEQLAELRRKVPHAELLVLDACRHTPHEEQPETVRDAVVDFLSRRLPSSCTG